MNSPSYYRRAPVPIRDDIVAAHAHAWERLARPGAWLDAKTRVAVAAETRHAPGCSLCRRRKEAVSPYSENGEHESLGVLPASLVEVVHRIRTDPGRLREAWFRDALAAGISEGEYVESVGVVATIVAVDTFARALGMAPHPLPEPRAGGPSHYRPAGVRPGPGWVSTVAPEDASAPEADLYAGRSPANIRRAMTLVPDEVRTFFTVTEAQYLPAANMRDFANEYRAITHAQIELLAGRVSAVNQCVY